jgi:hypothetical protein
LRPFSPTFPAREKCWKADSSATPSPSEGKVNIFTLAKNAGTSVSQIERFYARNLPISAELVKNLQSYGD